MPGKKLIVILTICTALLAGCPTGPDPELLQKIEDTKAMALEAKEKAESIKAQVSFIEDFDNGNESFTVAESAFEAEDYEKSLSDYEGSYTSYQASYDQAKTAMDKAKGAMDKADIAIEEAEKKAAEAEAEQQENADEASGPDVFDTDEQSAE